MADSKYIGFRNIFKAILEIDDDFMSAPSLRLASTGALGNYSDISNVPELKSRVVSAMRQAKREFPNIRKASADYFDEVKWANLLTNQIYQINRIGNDEIFTPVLIAEAEELLKDYYGIIV
jgi:hypothetical protein